jgi:hypothetical protein
LDAITPSKVRTVLSVHSVGNYLRHLSNPDSWKQLQFGNKPQRQDQQGVATDISATS